MRGYLVLNGLLIIGIGFAGKMMLLEKNEAFSFLQGGLTLGGALIICALFAGSHYRLGLIGGGVVALLGFCRTMVNLSSWAEWLAHSSPRSPATPLLEMIVGLLTLAILVGVMRILLAERTAKTRTGLLGKPDQNQ